MTAWANEQRQNIETEIEQISHELRMKNPELHPILADVRAATILIIRERERFNHELECMI